MFSAKTLSPRLPLGAVLSLKGRGTKFSAVVCITEQQSNVSRNRATTRGSPYINDHGTTTTTERRKAFRDSAHSRRMTGNDNDQKEKCTNGFCASALLHAE
jgi:hypothetical protein